MLKIRQCDYEEMIAHLRDVYPQEGCGLLAGTNGRTQRCFPIDNVEQSETDYTMDPKQQIRAFLKIGAEEWELQAIYHSHPQSAAYPSEKDVELAFYPKSVYLIISLADWEQPSVRAFTIRSGRVKETTFEVV